MCNRIFVFFLSIGLIVFSSGCEVFVDFGLKNTAMELYEARVPGSDLQMMPIMVTGYQSNNPEYRYIIHFFGNDRCTGSYYAADTLQYEVEGVWSLPSADILKIQLDEFVDADFNISKLDRRTFLLETESNAHGLPIEPATTPLHLYNRKVE
ncbi:MAG: hypothetical protein QF371_04005 [Flavobacteriales bacterium]|jgi:hypothetical protein|nr:hypothetical protein [Flavobacteriales bacterium]